MPLRALSFDLFDTLVDLRGVGDAFRTSTGALHAAVCEHREIEAEAFVAELRALDRELRKPRYAEGIEVATEERFAGLAQRLGIDAPGLAERLTDIHMRVIRDQVRVPEHHRALLRRLRERARLGLCSNFSHAPTARDILAESCLGPELEAVVISVEVGIRKPRAEIFEALLEKLGARPEETLHVGDSLRADVAGAAALGLATAWITRRVGDPEAELAHHEGPMPDFVVADLSEIGALLD